MLKKLQLFIFKEPARENSDLFMINSKERRKNGRKENKIKIVTIFMHIESAGKKDL